MNLTLKDRVLILNTVLPQFDTRKNMELKVSIDSKIAISEVDQKRIVIKDFIDRNGMFSEFTMPTYVKILDEPLKEEQPGE